MARNYPSEALMRELQFSWFLEGSGGSGAHLGRHWRRRCADNLMLFLFFGFFCLRSEKMCFAEPSTDTSHLCVFAAFLGLFFSHFWRALCPRNLYGELPQKLENAHQKTQKTTRKKGRKSSHRMSSPDPRRILGMKLYHSRPDLRQ